MVRLRAAQGAARNGPDLIGAPARGKRRERRAAIHPPPPAFVKALRWAGPPSSKYFHRRQGYGGQDGEQALSLSLDA